MELANDQFFYFICLWIANKRFKQVTNGDTFIVIVDPQPVNKLFGINYCRRQIILYWFVEKGLYMFRNHKDMFFVNVRVLQFELQNPGATENYFLVNNILSQSLTDFFCFIACFLE